MNEQCGFLSVEQMAAYLGVSTKTIYRRLADGTIRKAPLGSRLIRIPASEIDRLDGSEPYGTLTDNSKRF